MSRNKRRVTGPPVRLPVSDGGSTLVDAQTAEKLRGRRLHAVARGYVRLYRDGRPVYLHRFVCPAPADKQVDHRNGDKRDNRAANLRAVTCAENHRAHRLSRGRYPWRGVCVHHRKCTARVGASGTRRYRGVFVSPLIAAFARDDGARRLGWPPESLNFGGVIHRQDLLGFLKATNGMLFGVVFVRRRDGAVRRMLCRTGVTKSVTGAGLRFEPADRDLFSVYDVRKRQHRFIPLENVLCLTYNKKKYRVLTHGFTIAA